MTAAEITAASGARVVDVFNFGFVGFAPLMIAAGESVIVTASFGATEDFELFQASSFEVDLAAVPVPAALPLALAGFGGLVGWSKRRKQA